MALLFEGAGVGGVGGVVVGLEKRKTNKKKNGQSAKRVTQANSRGNEKIFIFCGFW